MTFDTNEISNFSGSPIALYQFERGSQVFRFASADRDIEFGGDTYTSAPIAHEGMMQSGDRQADSFNVNVAAASAVAQLYTAGAPSEPVTLTVRRWHYGDTDAPIYWIGSVIECKRRDDATATLICQSVSTMFGRSGLRLGWQRTCPHALYDSQCRADKAAFAVPAVVTAFDGVTILADAFGGFPNNYFTAGFIEWSPVEGTTERRAIRTHFTTAIAVLGGTYGLSVGAAIVAYPGCLHTLADCKDKFNNLPNYGGFAAIPGRSPFDGNPVF